MNAKPDPNQLKLEEVDRFVFYSMNLSLSLSSRPFSTSLCTCCYLFFLRLLSLFTTSSHFDEFVSPFVSSSTFFSQLWRLLEERTRVRDSASSPQTSLRLHFHRFDQEVMTIIGGRWWHKRVKTNIIPLSSSFQNTKGKHSTRSWDR